MWVSRLQLAEKWSRNVDMRKYQSHLWYICVQHPESLYLQLCVYTWNNVSRLKIVEESAFSSISIVSDAGRWTTNAKITSCSKWGLVPFPTALSPWSDTAYRTTPLLFSNITNVFHKTFPAKVSQAVFTLHQHKYCMSNITFAPEESGKWYSVPRSGQDYQRRGKASPPSGRFLKDISSCTKGPSIWGQHSQVENYNLPICMAFDLWS